MIMTMRERLQAKLGNANDNAFKMRRLFKMYDRQGSGMVGVPGQACQPCAPVLRQNRNWLPALPWCLHSVS